MAEKKGFFRKIFSFGSDSEEQRTPENGGLPSASDTEVGREGAPDPDARPVSAAHAGADTEAGAGVEDGGGITPLDPDASRPSQDAATETAGESIATDATSGETQKKTLKSPRSRWS